MAGLTPVATRLVSTTSAGRATVLAEVGLVPRAYATYAASTSSIWSIFSSIAPADYANDAGGPYRAYLRAYANEEDWLSDLPTDVTRYAERLAEFYDHEPTSTTYWSRQNIAELSPSTVVVVTATTTVTAGSAAKLETDGRNTSLSLVVIATVLPVCLLALFLVLAFLLWHYRRRIIEYLHKKYNASSANDLAGIKPWPPITDSVSTTSINGIRPNVDTSMSSRPGPRSIARIKGRQNTPSGTTHSSDLNRDRHCSADQVHSYVAYRPRCPTPDTPLSRRTQLANRSQEIKELHTRLGSTSPEPHTIPELDATGHAPVQHQSGRRLLRSASDATCRKVSPHIPAMPPSARPISPTGSIRLVDRNSTDTDPHERVPSDAIGRHLEEAFMPEWQPEGANRLHGV